MNYIVIYAFNSRYFREKQKRHIKYQFNLLYNPVVVILYLSYMQNCVDNQSIDCTVADLSSTHRKSDSDYAIASGYEANKDYMQIHNILP